MSIDIFGRSLKTVAVVSGPPGAPGRGFKINSNGQYDLENKRLCEVGQPVNDNDAITLKFMRDFINKELSLLERTIREDQSEIISYLHSEVVSLRTSLDLLKKENQELKRKKPKQEELGKKMEDKKSVIAYELHRPARKNYQRRHVDIRGLDETWQADLVEMIPYSKYAWAVPINNKSANDVTKAMDSILKHGRIPQNLHVDQGKEFYNQEFRNLMKKYKINMYSTFSNLKASICERFNRTLKTNMWRKFTARGTYKWIDMIDDLVNTYNNTKHRTIKMKPADVTVDNEQDLKKSIYQPLTTLRKKLLKNKFKVGDKVRISKYKNVYEKGYTANWTTEIFTINKVQNTNPTTYKLADYQDQPIEGAFYSEELSKTKHPDVYLVEKIVKKKGSKYYVKWLGFDTTHNSWINKTDL
ncbi:uncharacterized protein LOC123261422 [Cotesia glomerata]|uniref:uncharacterized protein LOC123261422 n=1 Tax=Cotesia glomerata TaxID=32391 RepID=UPI001D00A261|nr:uncharacterized protein LOC123261422 [Cotesia glomerata]